jgi:hypothetical protein
LVFVDQWQRGELLPPLCVRRRPVEQKPVVEIDLIWLKEVLNWAMSWEEQPRHRLLRENPVRGFQVPEKRTPVGQWRAMTAMKPRVR